MGISVFSLLICTFMSIEQIHLIDESKDVTFVNESETDPSDLSNQDPQGSDIKGKEKSMENNNETKSADRKRITAREYRMQKLMSKHMNEFLSDLKQNIENTSDLDKIEELRKTYQNEVEFKLEVDSLINKLEKDLFVKDESSVSEEVKNKKRIVDKEVSDNTKKLKKS